MGEIIVFGGSKPPPNTDWLLQAAGHLLEIGRRIGIHVTGMQVFLHEDGVEKDFPIVNYIGTDGVEYTLEPPGVDPVDEKEEDDGPDAA